MVHGALTDNSMWKDHLAYLVADFVERTLFHRETVRAAGAVSLSLEKIQEKYGAGLEPRA